MFIVPLMNYINEAINVQQTGYSFPFSLPSYKNKGRKKEVAKIQNYSSYIQNKQNASRELKILFPRERGMLQCIVQCTGVHCTGVNNIFYNCIIVQRQIDFFIINKINFMLNYFWKITAYAFFYENTFYINRIQ